MPVSRRYLCDDCGGEFNRLHWDRNEPAPECPFCESEKARNIPGTFAIGTIKGKAVDIAYKVAEESYGMTDMNDNSREGDVAFKGPSPIQTAEREAMVQQMKDAMGPDVIPDHLAPQVAEFWKNSATPPMPPEAKAQHDARVAAARANAAPARTAGEDPMALLHKAKPKMKLQPIARQKTQGGKLVN